MSHEIVMGMMGLAALITLIVIRMPIGYAMIVVGGVGVTLMDGSSIFLSQLKTLAFGKFSSYDLSVVPMFVLMGALAMRAGLSKDMFRAANAWMGWMRGGTAMAAIAACAIFGSVSGSSLATAATMGKVALPELERYKYKGSFATGTLAAGGVLGILIPPSVVLVIYAVLVEANIASMFMAAFVPGIMAVLMFILTIVLYVLVSPSAGPRGGAGSREEFIAATLGILPVLVIFLLVIGGIYIGLYNPTPAAAIGVFLVAIYSGFRRRLNWASIREALFETVRTSGMIYLILIGAEMLKIFMTRTGVPQAAADWMLHSGYQPMTILLLALLALILLGCLMDSISMVLLVVPFLWPVLMQLNGGQFQGADGSGFGMSTDDLKIWFGILSLIVIELGLITPPVGMNVFIISAMAKDVPMIETFKGVMPFFLMELVRVSLIIAFPVLTLWLPGLLQN